MRTKHNKTTGERKLTYRLVEAYRSSSGIRQYDIVNFGELPELTTHEQRRLLARRVEQLIVQYKQQSIDIFPCDHQIVESLAQDFFQKILAKERVDIEKGKQKELIEVDSVKLKDVQDIGAEWLTYQVIEQLQLPQLFKSFGWDKQKTSLAITHLISRAVYPASELRTSKWIKENASVCEVTGYDKDKINKDKLYRISLDLFKHQQDIEQHIANTTNNLFNLDDKIIIYDLTNTYFESKQNGTVAKYGRSKEKRNDCKLIVLALVVNVEGFIKYSKLFEGNTTDSTTLEQILEKLNKKQWINKPTIVLDAGIATDANIKLMQANNYKYICVARGGLNKYIVDSSSPIATLRDKKNQTIEIQRAMVEGWDDTQLLVHSHTKELKESSMRNAVENRYQQDFDTISRALQKPRGIKTLEKVWQRLGRLMQKYPTISKRFSYEPRVAADGITVLSILHTEKSKPSNEGKYLLRTNLKCEDEKNQWLIYNSIREIESSFRCLKTDLDLRPIYHKNDEPSKAHLHLGLLAYSIVNTIRHQLKLSGINNEWTDIVRIMNTQKVGTATMLNTYNQTINVRKCTKPSEKVSEIYQSLNFKSKPFHIKKDVVPPEQKKIFKPLKIADIRV